MLNLILGLSGTGKTYTAYNKIKQCIENKEQSLLIVPEQFTQGAEFRIYKLFSDAGSAFVSVCSFSGYAQRILKENGGIAVEALTDAGRAVYVRRAMDAVKDKLLKYGKHRRSPAFCQMCAKVITELKTAGATPENLICAAENGTKGQSMRELSLMYKAYNVIAENTVLDPADRIILATQKLLAEQIQDVNVFVDNFDGFTFPEYQMLYKLMGAKSFNVMLCCDSLQDNEAGMGLTSPVKATASKLRAMAAKLNVPVASPVILTTDYRHKASPRLRDVSDLLCGKDAQEGIGGEFYVTAYNSREQEAKNVAAQIATLNRQGVPFDEIAIICRSLDEYEYPLRHQMKIYNIPYFLDSGKTVENTAVAGFMRSGLSLLKNGINSEDVLRILKSGLCGYSQAEISALENYAYTWRLYAQDWRQPFVNNPAGFGEMNSHNKAELQIVERIRGSVVAIIEKFINKGKNGDVLCISEQLYYLLDSFHGSENLLLNAQVLEENNKSELAMEMCRSWDLAMEFLSQMPLLMQNQDITPLEYDELLLILMRGAELGNVPLTQNAVIITTADRGRLESPQYSFVIGSIEGEFPKTVGASGLLTHQDREALVANGVDMPGSFEHRMLLEQMFYYKALSSAKNGLYLSFVPAGMGGGELSSEASIIVNALNPKPLEISFEQLCATPAAALDTICEAGLEQTRQTASVLNALNDCGEEKKAISAMEAASNKADFEIKDSELLHRIFGDKITLSPTKIERYHSCHFAYFVEYILKIRLRKKAELSPLESGSLIHYVLENVLSLLNEGFENASIESLNALCNEFVDKYINDKMPDASLRFEKIISRIKESVVSLLEYMQREQAQSSFKPVAFEENIGDDAVKPIELAMSNGSVVRVVGKIDRVDIMEREGKSYIRVVDYKTGEKIFSLGDVYCGHNMQMLLYMFTLCKNGQEKYANPSPAGVLYLLADPSPKIATRNMVNTNIYETDGILLQDKSVLRGMDKEAKGVFIPVKLNNDGSLPKSTKLASLEKLGRIESHINNLVVSMAQSLYEGKIDAKPLVNGVKSPCNMCDYCAVCRHEKGFNETEREVPKNIFEAKEAQE